MKLAPSARPWRASAALAATCAALGGCGAGDTPGSHLLVPGAAALCTSVAAETYTGSCRFGWARRFDDTLALSAVGTLSGGALSWSDLLFTSTDGEGWLETELNSNATTQPFSPEPPAVFQLGDDFYALIRYPNDSPEGYAEYIARLDDWIPRPSHVGPWWGPAFARDGELLGLDQDPYGGFLTRTWRRFDPRTEQLTWGTWPVPESDPRGAITTWATGPSMLTALTLTSDRLCRVQSSSGGKLFFWDCVPRSALPPDVEDGYVLRAGPYGPMLLLRSPTGAWAATVTRAPDADPLATVREGVLRIADLGSPKVTAQLDTVHAVAPLSPFWAVGEISDARGVHVERFVRVKADMSLDVVDIPVTPCTAAGVDELCEQTFPAGVAPIGGDEFLAVYQVSTLRPPHLGGRSALVVLKVSVPPCPECAAVEEERPPARPILEREITACAKAHACGFYGYPVDASVGGVVACAGSLVARDTVNTISPTTTGDALFACGQTATSCRDLALCLNGAHDEAYCAAHPGGSCDGTVAVSCPSTDAPAAVATECDVAGNACWLFNGQAACGIERQCIPAEQHSCVTATTAYTCNGFIAMVVECAPGSVCRVAAQSSTPLCVPTTACGGNDHCEGDVWVGCQHLAEYGYQTRIDCAQRGSACSESGCVSTPCPGVTDVCEGDVLYGCIGGQDVLYDCRAHGFSRCGAGLSGLATCLF